MEEIFIILGTMTTAILYSLTAYLKKREKSGTDENEPFNMNKLLSTALYGLFIGIVAVYSGNGMTREYFEIQSLSYGMVAVLIQNIVTLITRVLDNNNI